MSLFQNENGSYTIDPKTIFEMDSTLIQFLLEVRHAELDGKTKANNKQERKNHLEDVKKKFGMK